MILSVEPKKKYLFEERSISPKKLKSHKNWTTFLWHLWTALTFNISGMVTKSIYFSEFYSIISLEGGIEFMAFAI